MKSVGKPDAGNPHVRFDERGWETGRRSASVPAPNLDSTCESGGEDFCHRLLSVAGEIDRVVLLAHGACGPPEKLKARKLFIVSRDDLGPGDKPRLPKIRAQFEKAPEPKELVILEGSAHAQFIFQTDQGERLMNEILRFLSAP
jgi:hypothetical protein